MGALISRFSRTLAGGHVFHQLASLRKNIRGCCRFVLPVVGFERHPVSEKNGGCLSVTAALQQAVAGPGYEKYALQRGATGNVEDYLAWRRGPPCSRRLSA